MPSAIARSAGPAYMRRDHHTPRRASRMLDHPTGGPPLRDVYGAVRLDFVARVSEAIDAVNVDTLRDLVAALHEAALGALVEALQPERRPRLVELLGIDFDFTALTEVD